MVVSDKVADWLGGVNPDLSVSAGGLGTKERCGFLHLNFGEPFVNIYGVVVVVGVGGCVCIGVFLCSRSVSGGVLVLAFGVSGLFLCFLVFVAFAAVVVVVGVGVAVNGFHSVELPLKGVDSGVHLAHFTSEGFHGFLALCQSFDKHLFLVLYEPN